MNFGFKPNLNSCWIFSDQCSLNGWKKWGGGCSPAEPLLQQEVVHCDSFPLRLVVREPEAQPFSCQLGIPGWQVSVEIKIGRRDDGWHHWLNLAMTIFGQWPWSYSVNDISHYLCPIVYSSSGNLPCVSFHGEQIMVCNFSAGRWTLFIIMIEDLHCERWLIYTD